MNSFSTSKIFSYSIAQSGRLIAANAYLLSLCLTFLLTFPVYSSSAPSGLFFSAPYSGEKVAEYEISLPITRKGRQSFSIPNDCQSVQDALNNGAHRWGTRVDRSIWRKVRLDCDYVRFLHTFPRKPVHDYVSGYDFMNAELQDITLRISCDEATDNNHYPESCKENFTLDLEDFAFFFPWKKEDNKQLEVRSETCRIKDGIFRGRVFHDRTGFHCVQDNSEPGFRLIAVDYADVNGDDYLDVVLRLIPLGRGLSRTPIVLPLTRKEPSGVFTIPKNLPSAVPAP